MEPLSYLVLGATGQTGVQVVKQLLKLNKPVTVVIRSQSKLSSSLSQNELSKLTAVIKHDFVYDNLEENTELQTSLSQSTHVLDLMGPSFWSNSQHTAYENHRDIINFLKNAEKKKLKLFVLLSSSVSDNAFSFAVLLNYLIDNVVGWTALAENSLRKSGLPYYVVKPPRLTNELVPKRIAFSQLNDTLRGKQISRYNLADAIAKLTESKIGSRVTFELHETDGKEDTFEGKEMDAKLFREDSDGYLVRAEHFKVNRIFSFGMTSLIYFLVFWLIIWLYY